ncbi:putative PB1 domain-containing protein [Rosa chinensis]|uniref:Putative PB1 domain-containing protein n=2 Tax=Rosa chinensis TaxID=74649 RepID=A0A2P6PCV6_ROSCH|nr:putative PB1 domain-containing protein [Rosa chinensis]
MACEAGGGGQENASSGLGSPKKNRDRIKLLCSYGGKILPRPSDGILKYVGGETRVLAWSRDATFSELMNKLSAVVDGDMVLKYQLIPEDLDALVSVRSDEDVKHMLDEYDRQENQGMSPRLRTFLFPSKPIMIENSSHSLELEQRYIDAINGIVRSSKQQPPSIIGSPHIAGTSSIGNCSSPIASYSPLASFSSACSSPKSGSPEHHFMVVQEANQILQASRFSLPPVMHKVQSSPSLSGNLNLQQYHNLNFAHRHHQGGGGGYHYQQPQSGHYQISRSLSRNSHPHNHSRGGRGSPTPPHMSPRGRSESGSVRSLMGQSRHNSGCSSPRQQNQGPNAGEGNDYCDDPYGYNRVDRAESLPTSPRQC